jgi:hypothetical protein
MFVYPGRDSAKVNAFWKEMINVGKKLCPLTEPKWIEIPDTRTGTYLNALRSATQQGPHMVRF